MTNFGDNNRNKATYGTISIGSRPSTLKENRSRMGETKKLPQVVATFAATIGAFSLGTALTWTSPALPFLVECDLPGQSSNETGNPCSLPTSFTAEQGSWIGSLFAVGALIGSQSSGYLLSMIGRKWSMILMNIPFIIGWVLLIITKPLEVSNPALFYVGRILTGFGAGCFTLAPPMYTNETAETSIVGALGSVTQFMITIGIGFVNACGIESAVDWVVITGICIVFPVLSMVAMFFMPESPVYLISKGKEEEAKKSLHWLRGTENVGEEIEVLKQSQKAQESTGRVGILGLFKSREYFEPWLIMIIFMFFQQFSGINAVIFYLKDIFIKAGSDMDPGLSAFIIGVVQILATGVAVLVVDKFGRKPLLMTSGTLMCASIFALGAYFYLDEHAKTPDEMQLVSDIGVLPLISLIVYIAAFSLGFGPLAWAINAEIFQAEAKGTASPIITMFNWTCAFLVSKLQNNINEAIGSYGSYFLFGSVCGVAVAFVFFIVPETKGKTNDDMKAYWLKRAGKLSQSGRGMENPAYTGEKA